MSLAQSLTDTVRELADAYQDYAVVLEVELRAKVAALATAQASNYGVGATEQYVTIATVDAAAEVIKARFNIKALETYRDYFMAALSRA